MLKSPRLPLSADTDPFMPAATPLSRGAGFATVAGLHVALIASAFELAARPEVRDVTRELHVRLIETPQPKIELPVTRQARPQPVARREIVPIPETPLPVLVAAPVTSPAPAAAFSVPPQPPAPPLLPPIQAAPPAPPAALVAARFDADYLDNPKPSYPIVSRRLGEEGKILLRVRVSAEGNALAVELRQSSGFPRLDEAAAEAVRRWRFVPARRGDEAVESWVTIPIVYKLDA